ncbi:MAG: hypothetical protein ABEH81_09660 [Halopenitus sp.]
MSGKAFISHSRHDEQLVDRIDRALDLVGYDTLIYEWEDIPDEEPDREVIKRKMSECDACFVFPTSTVRDQQVTPAWLIAESSIAGDQNIPTAIFKEEGDSYEINFPYFDVLVVYDSADLPLQLQEGIEELMEAQGDEAAGAIGGGILGAATIGTGGAALVGALLGAALSSGGDKAPQVQCPACEWAFTYWGDTDEFNCPHCHTPMDSNSHSIGED